MTSSHVPECADGALPLDLCSLDAVVITEHLAARPWRAPDYRAENAALHAVAAAMAVSPRAALAALMREALALCCPDGNATTGVSLLERDAESAEDLFRWTAMDGRLSALVGGSTRRAFSPCGVTLDRMAPVLFDRPARYFTYFSTATAPLFESLVLPFRVNEEPAGTIWIVAHDAARHFDTEDVRVMTSLADFTGMVYGVMRAREAADEARVEGERLLQTVSHEWRTPLAAITGLTTLVADGIVGTVTDEQREMLRRARSAADHLLVLVNDTIARAQPDGSSSAFHFADVELTELVAEAVAMVEPAARAAGLGLVAEVGLTSVVVHADATRLRQIVFNLLANAVKFTASGRIIVTVHQPESSMARITVEDSGIGIAPDHLNLVFRRFWQATSLSSPRETREGVGLGLAVSHNLARAMRGDLSVTSRLGEGSIFSLTLPTTAT